VVLVRFVTALWYRGHITPEFAFANSCFRRRRILLQELKKWIPALQLTLSGRTRGKTWFVASTEFHQNAPRMIIPVSSRHSARRCDPQPVCTALPALAAILFWAVRAPGAEVPDRRPPQVASPGYWIWPGQNGVLPAWARYRDNEGDHLRLLAQRCREFSRSRTSRTEKPASMVAVTLCRTSRTRSSRRIPSFVRCQLSARRLWGCGRRSR
jgi:hypothetical protein